MTPSGKLIQDIVAGISPIDALEAEHKNDVHAWVASGAPLFRIAKPDNPPKHLVSYFVLYDGAAGKLMLIDHVKAKLWLPTGGHVDLDEDPKVTVIREAEEELAIDAEFKTKFGEHPLFVTVTTTKGYGEHTDVSFWYVINGDSERLLSYDSEEMHGYKWLSLDEVLAMDITKLDPHMHRFVGKMRARL
jgi:8-oxo-dGTP pyrophosphatase MutT (NUDIX family)